MQKVAVEPRGAREGDKVTVGIRPEHLHVESGEWGVGARAMTVESLGDAAYLYAETPVAPDGLIARIEPLATHERGATMKLGAAPDHCHLFDANGQAFERRFAQVMAA
jgi:multiple sugar transport system ATP-binding protein